MAEYDVVVASNGKAECVWAGGVEVRPIMKLNDGKKIARTNFAEPFNIKGEWEIGYLGQSGQE